MKPMSPRRMMLLPIVLHNDAALCVAARALLCAPLGGGLAQDQVVRVAALCSSWSPRHHNLTTIVTPLLAATPVLRSAPAREQQAALPSASHFQSPRREVGPRSSRHCHP